jgi:hypothetical protein
VSAMECIKVARAVMTVNPGAKAVEIADAVSLELGKNWMNEATKRRNGNAIKRWLIWLEPHVPDPDESIDAAARLTMVGKSIVGRPSLRASVKERFVKMVEMEMSTAEIAEAFNVTRQTIYVWLRQYGLRTEKGRPQKNEKPDWTQNPRGAFLLHWLRHAHASHAIDNGTPITLVSATLGHADIKTTPVYVHPRPGESSGRYLKTK